ncbi:MULTISPECIES: Tfp pilus assembly protein FimT/FimU [Acinetobacter]|uniref:pilus assembly FimT family protein n=1 Tax=Acinetobacter TaxID=469 RepID=UPI0015D21D43|nr:MULTISPECIES: prepilin-type N-terminal cleavage/methylation domain-containing protein [Acinetobacter]QOW51957.1 prepilin-type N-terminal cleavage/methylation domain-containing protein [Acinetobacter indicus]
MRKSQGFTLIELMVTIAVLAVIVMIAVPNMMPMVYKKQLETTTIELAQTLAKARGTAISLRKDITLEFDDLPSAGNHLYWVPRYEQVHIISKDAPEGLMFSPVGLAKERATSLKRKVPNPDFDPNKNEDPLENPKFIIEWQPTKDLVFEVCHEKVNEIKSITIFKSGVISNIVSRELAGSCP